MNKEDIAYRVEQYLNGEIESADIYLEKPEMQKNNSFTIQSRGLSERINYIQMT